MEWMDPAINVLNEAEYLGLAFLLATVAQLDRRKHWVPFLVLSCSLALVLSFFTDFIDVHSFVGSGVLNYGLMVLFGLLCLMAVYQEPFVLLLFYGMSAYSVKHFIYLIWQLLTYVDEMVTGNDLSVPSWKWYVYAIPAVFLGFLLIFFLLREEKRMHAKVAPPKSMIVFIAFTLAFTIVFNLFAISDEFVKPVLYYQLLINLFNLSALVLMLIAMYTLLARSQLSAEIESLKAVEAQQEKQYQLSKENIDLINVRCHDLRHQIRSLKESSREVDSKELDSIEQALRIYDTRFRTGNTTLDVLLQEKGLICKNQGITLEGMLDGGLLNFLENREVYSLFGNLLDNAIDSVKKVPNPNERVITLKVHATPLGVFVYEENPYVGTIQFDPTGLPKTDKADTTLHGYGMKSIRMTVKAHGGSLQIDPTEGRFRISILFPKES